MKMKIWSKDVLTKYNLQGRFPENDNEILIVKPCIQVHENGYGLSIDHLECDNNILDIDLKVGNNLMISYINTYDDSIEKSIDREFNIVGTIEFNNIKPKEERLFNYDFAVITNSSTYQKYFEDHEQLCYFDISAKSSVFELKKELFEMQKRYPDSSYHDTSSELQLRSIQNIELILKDSSFSLFF
ncbi:MAG: hypothetical protein ACLSBH_14715 [Coprobacillus cateniformis]